MNSAENIFEIEIASHNHLWWHFNLFASAVCYGSQIGKPLFANAVDNDSHLDRKTARPPFRLVTEPCAYFELYIYAIPAILPPNDTVRETPVFDAEITISLGGKIVRKIECDVNQYGGVTVAGERISL